MANNRERRQAKSSAIIRGGKTPFNYPKGKPRKLKVKEIQPVILPGRIIRRPRSTLPR